MLKKRTMLVVIVVALALQVSPVFALPFTPPPPRPPEFDSYIQILDESITNINMEELDYYLYTCKNETCSISAKNVIVISSSGFWAGPDIKLTNFGVLTLVTGEIYGILNKGDVLIAIATK